MNLSSWARKAALTAHIAASVGWLGAVAAYLPLDITAALSDDAQLVRAAYIGMGLIAKWALVPLALTALLTGILVSLGTPWGLFRHYWVILSLALTSLAVLVLLMETQTIGRLAAIAADPTTSDDALRRLPGTLVHSVGGAIVLLVVLALNVYKPRGLTRYGWRKQQEARAHTQP